MSAGVPVHGAALIDRGRAVAWVLACGVGAVVGLLAGWTLGDLLFGAAEVAGLALRRAGLREAPALWSAPFGAALWATVAAAQWLLLRSARPRVSARAWVAASGAAGAVGWVAALVGAVALGQPGRLGDDLQRYGVPADVALSWALGVPSLGFVGCLVGLAQARLLVDRPAAVAWVLATTVGAALGGAVGWELVGGTLVPARIIVAGLAAGLIVDPLSQPPGLTVLGALKFGLVLGTTTLVALLLRRGRQGPVGR